MACLHLIRHGQAGFGADNYDALSPRGHEQARHLAHNLRQPDHLISGRMGRHAESRGTFRTRVRKALAEVVEKFDKSDRAYVVTSGGPIAAIVQDTLGLSEGATRGIEKALVNCGSRTLSVRPGSSQLISLNEHQHLGAINADLITFH